MFFLFAQCGLANRSNTHLNLCGIKKKLIAIKGKKKRKLTEVKSIYTLLACLKATDERLEKAAFGYLYTELK